MLWVVVLSSGTEAKADLKALEAYNRGIKMLFAENVGQLSNDVVFYSMHPSVVYILRDGSIHINGVRVSFGSKPRFITGDMPLKTKISYFGRNKAISNVPTYRRVVFKEVYPKVDAIFTADGRGIVEFQFIVRPGGDPHRIKVETDGRVVQREDGIYIVKEGKELVKISDLKAYQGAEEVEVRAEVKGKEVRFSVDNWDRRHTLVIDPIATAILASSHMDLAVDIDTDGAAVYVAGRVGSSASFAPHITFGSDSLSDAFVSKLSGDLSAHIATAVLASTGHDEAFALEVDGGEVYVAGHTFNYLDFAPTRTVYGPTGGYTEVFVSKLSADLFSHIATAILASTSHDYAYALALDTGAVYVAGYTTGPSTFAPSRTTFGTSDQRDAFVSKLSRNSLSHMATAILASTDWDYAYALAVDGVAVYVAGKTLNSSDFAPNRTVFGNTGSSDAFVSKLRKDLGAHLSTAVLASNGEDAASDVMVVGDVVYVVGRTADPTSFVPNNLFGSSGIFDAFVSKLDSSLTLHMATAVLASDGSDAASAVAFDGSVVYIAGRTENASTFSSDRTVIGTSGYYDAFISKMTADLSSHITTVVLASPTNDYAYDVLLVGTSVYVCGVTNSSQNFAQGGTTFGTAGLDDAFVSKLFITLDVSEGYKTREEISISGNILRIDLPTSAYVGFDVYSPDGRLIRRVSLSYLPAGKYEYRLKLPKGSYLLKVRVGDDVREIKGVF